MASLVCHSRNCWVERMRSYPKGTIFWLWMDKDRSGKAGVDGILWILWMGYMLMTAWFTLLFRLHLKFDYVFSCVWLSKKVCLCIDKMTWLAKGTEVHITTILEDERTSSKIWNYWNFFFMSLFSSVPRNLERQRHLYADSTSSEM